MDKTSKEIGQKVKVKIRKKEYIGTIVKQINSVTFLIEYEIGNKKIKGIFNEKDVDILCENEMCLYAQGNELTKRNHYRIECQKCKTVVVSDKDATECNGFCPECNSRKWNTIEYVGYF